MSRTERESLLSVGAALVAAVVAVTCHRGTRLDVPVAVAGPGAQSKAAPSAPASSEATARSAAPAVLASSFAKTPPGPLPLRRLYAALAGLEAKSRDDHVRIVWYGDSHTAADYLTGTVRRRLETRFGAGGPGFVRVGTSPYR